MIERATGLLGIAALLGLAWLFSVNRRAVDWRTVAIALALQLAIALFALHTPVGDLFFRGATRVADAFIGYADRGIEFVFGRWPEQVLGTDGRPVRLPFVLAVRVLPIIIFMGSVFSVLYHLGIAQRVVHALARGLRAVLPVSGAESLSTIADVFVGMTEAPLLVRPYVERMTRSELFCVMTAGLATIAGSVLVVYIGMLGAGYAGHLITASFMAAPAAIAVAKIVVPETGVPETLGGAHIALERGTVNVIDAAATGASEGLRLALNVGAMLIAFVALVWLVNDTLATLGAAVGVPGLSFERILGFVLAPLAFLLGVPWVDAPRVAELLGIKVVLNEFLAYQRLSEMLPELSPRAALIASYACCGFGNFGSLAILLGGLGGMAPSRRGDIARDGLRAVLAGSLATFMTAAVAGIVA
jgi:CNT family concentrative nucleoside transporter